MDTIPSVDMASGGRFMPMFTFILFSLPINNPFPNLLRLSLGIIAVFSVLLLLAKLKHHPKKWLHTLFFLLIICGAILAGVSGYYSLSGPSAADPFVPRTDLHNSYFSLYLFVIEATLGLLLFIVLVTCLSLFFLFFQRKRK